MIVPLTDKEKKMREYMYLAGVGPISYYLGLYFADFLLFLITQTLFTITVYVMQLGIYTSHIVSFTFIMMAFGAVLIPFTYFFSQFFKDTDAAFKFIGVTYICIGIFLPILF